LSNAAPLDPKKVGEYLVVRPLGSGGMGIVCLGVGKSGVPVAIKIVRSELADQSNFRARFAREVDAIKSVRGPCTAGFVDANTEQSPQWVAMDYVPGQTLTQYVDAYGPLAADQVQLLAWSLAQALHDIHAARLIHRDLKPSNVILSPTGPKVVDFGVAHRADATSLTATGEQVGSLGWMAPEQLFGTGETTATDVHAWGAVVLYAATGQLPFEPGSSESVAWQIMNTTPDLRAFAAILPGLFPLVSAALSTDPRDRPDVTMLITGCRTTVDPEATTVLGTDDIRTVLDARWSLADVPADLDLKRQIKQARRRQRTRTIRRRGLPVVAVAASIAVVVVATMSLTNREQVQTNTNTDSTQQAPAAAAEVDVTIGVSGCDDCTINAVWALESLSQDTNAPATKWSSGPLPVQDGRVRFTVPASKAQGLAFEVDSPRTEGSETVVKQAFAVVRYEGFTASEAVPANRAATARNAYGCWAGTTSAAASLTMQVDWTQNSLDEPLMRPYFNPGLESVGNLKQTDQSWGDGGGALYSVGSWSCF